MKTYYSVILIESIDQFGKVVPQRTEGGGPAGEEERRAHYAEEAVKKLKQIFLDNAREPRTSRSLWRP